MLVFVYRSAHVVLKVLMCILNFLHCCTAVLLGMFPGMVCMYVDGPVLVYTGLQAKLGCVLKLAVKIG